MTDNISLCVTPNSKIEKSVFNREDWRDRLLVLYQYFMV